MIRAILIGFFFSFCSFNGAGQEMYFKDPGREVISQIADSTSRVILQSVTKDTLLVKKFNYVLQFYPNILVRNIVIDFRKSKHIAKTRPYFRSIFKAPAQRDYHITFSSSTASTMDSVMLSNLSLNSQLGLIASQISLIEDLSTGGFFNFLAYFYKQHSASGKNQLHRSAEERTLEVGLGYQLLAYNEECLEKLKIENWMSVIGYSTYIRYYRNRPMRPEKVIDFINDLPVYITHSYK